MFDLTNPIYSDKDKARWHLEALHWPDGPICPHCGSVEGIKKLAGKSTRPGVYKCNPCRKPFTVTVGTIFEDSKIPLNKRSEEHTSELQSLMRISYAVFCLKKKKYNIE